MAKLQTLLILMVASLGVLVVVPEVAQALDPQCQPGGPLVGTEYCDNQSSENPIVGPNGVLTKATELISTLVGIASVIVIVIAGLMLTLSNGDPNNYNKARNAIIYALAGLVIAIFARTIVIYVLTRF